MHHSTARLAVARILAGDGFGDNAVALTHAVLLHDRSDCPPAMRQAILDRCLAAPPDRAAACANPLNQQPVPGDGRGLAAQLAPMVLAHPACPGMGMSSLWAAEQLWDHLGTDERPLLRGHLINTIAARRIDVEAQLSTFQLRDWQKKVPTHYGTAKPSVASLRAILEAPTALESYLLLAEYLGMGVDLQTLCWVLGSLSVQLLQTHHDRSNHLGGVLAGAVSCERLTGAIPVDALVTIISQLAHRLWWLKQRAGLRPIRTSLDNSVRPFAQAVYSGDLTVAQRSARVLSMQEPARFWDECWNLVGEHALEDQRSLGRLLAVMDAARWRAGDGLVGGDDAAAIAGILADLAWRRQHPESA